MFLLIKIPVKFSKVLELLELSVLPKNPLLSIPQNIKIRHILKHSRYSSNYLITSLIKAGILHADLSLIDVVTVLNTCQLVSWGLHIAATHKNSLKLAVSPYCRKAMRSVDS